MYERRIGVLIIGIGCVLAAVTFGPAAYLPRQQTAAEMSAQQIEDLRTGSIVVRLRSDSKAIQALKEHGMNGEAARRQEIVDHENRYVVNAFMAHFNFCPVFFMYKAGQFKLQAGDEGIFLNEFLEADPSIALPDSNYLIVELASLYEETTPAAVDPEQTKGKIPRTFASTPLKNNCLVVKDRNLVQLQRPFPFYVSTPAKISKIKSAVKRLNDNLFRYHNAVLTKKKDNANGWQE